MKNLQLLLNEQDLLEIFGGTKQEAAIGAAICAGVLFLGSAIYAIISRNIWCSDQEAMRKERDEQKKREQTKK